jgi:hypothetical protein
MNARMPEWKKKKIRNKELETSSQQPAASSQ